MITNNDLKRCHQQVFTHSAQYQAPFYGREKSIAEMQEKTAALKPGEVLVISQPLGTGKTFLVNHMISEKKIDVPRGINFLTARGIGENPTSMEQFPGEILVVDETDIKTPYKKLLLGMNNLQSYLEETGKKAIVIGDYSLRDAVLEKCLKNSKQLMNFEPIDRDFLCGTLISRFRSFMKEFIDEDFCIDDIIDPMLLNYLAPAWMRLVNSFRGVFSLLQEVVADDSFIRFNHDKAYLALSIFKKYLADDAKLDLDNAQMEFLHLLRNFIGSENPMGTGITKGFTHDELYQIAKTGKIDVEYDDFDEDIIQPLALAELLVPTGIPFYRDGQFVRRPEPYVPSLRLLISIS